MLKTILCDVLVFLHLLTVYHLIFSKMDEKLRYPISSEVLELQKESLELAREKQAREILQTLEDEGQEITKWYISNNQHLFYFLE